MSRIAAIAPQDAPDAARPLFEGVQAKIGAVPNLFRVLGNAPAALAGYLDFSAALTRGGFSARMREQIALTVAESNQCGYCLSAHTFVGEKLGLTTGEIADARHATATNARVDAILKLARSIVVSRGEISDEEYEQFRIAGLSDADIIETVANVALNIFSNYTNHLARTVVDFPEVKPGNGYLAPACACD